LALPYFLEIKQKTEFLRIFLQINFPKKKIFFEEIEMASAFAELGVCDEITTGLDEIGWSLPTDIQAQSCKIARKFEKLKFQN